MSNRFHFLRNDRKEIVACVAVNADRNANRVSYQISVHNPKDKFSRRRAREIAEARLEKRPIKVADYVPDSGHHINRLVMNDLLDRDDLFEDRYGQFWGLSSRMRRIVEDWLDWSYAREGELNKAVLADQVLAAVNDRNFEEAAELGARLAKTVLNYDIQH